LELAAQLGVVVDLAVVDHDHPATLAGHRLRAAFQIDDREPAVREADATAAEHTGGVGAAVRDERAHRVELTRRDGCHAVHAAGDPAHEGSSLSGCSRGSGGSGGSWGSVGLAANDSGSTPSSRYSVPSCVKPSARAGAGAGSDSAARIAAASSTAS